MENIIELLKITIWPLLIAIFFISYSKEIRKFMWAIVAKIEDAHNISIGAIKLEIDQKSEARGIADVGNKLSKLSRPAFEIFIKLKSGLQFIKCYEDIDRILIPNKTNRMALYELSDRGLIEMPISKSEFESFVVSFIDEEEEQSTFWQHQKTKKELTKDDFKKYDGMAFSVTPKGIEANELLIEVLSKYLTK
jgi:hypothetical protein